MSILGSAIVLLGAAVVAVPIFKRLKLGAIMGYLVAGALIGPSAMNLVNDPNTIMHVAEIGVVLFLFLIGIELEPEKLWRMRHAMLLTGGSQIALTTAVICGVLLFVDVTWPVALVIAMAIALSSTAFALQLMSEHRMLKSPTGQQGFGILLMQDLIVIPILFLVDALGNSGAADSPAWYTSLLALLAVLVAGRYCLNPFLRLVSKWGSSEVMTASALLIVLATGYTLESVGLSMGMGAFIAGVLLANSSFRHQVETEIEPFKGLLLGLFFIAIGMNLDLALLTEQPLIIVSAALALVAVKTLIIWALLRLGKQSSKDSLHLGLMLSQGGEFAFVVMTQAVGNGLVETALANQVTLVVGLSMALTAPLVILHSQFFSTSNCPKVYDTSRDQEEPEVIIAGFGRFGQISARILAANNIPFTALDNNAEHIEFVKQFGNKVFYGDASRLDLLKMAGIADAKVMLLALDNEEESLRVAELVSHHYPDVHLVARAHNRFSLEQFQQQGVRDAVRELMGSSLEAAHLVLQAYGYSQIESDRLVNTFKRHDDEILASSPKQTADLKDRIDHEKHNREQLAGLFQRDRSDLPEAE
ncbi:MAG: monovalent cation:proton antiporter-2 (CPA2) family protein [Pseudomonadales bacterium]